MVAGALPGRVREELEQRGLTCKQLLREALKRVRVRARDVRRQLHEQHRLTGEKKAATGAEFAVVVAIASQAVSNSRQRFSNSTREEPRIATNGRNQPHAVAASVH